MSSIIFEPDVKNYLSNGGFNFVIDRLPNVTYFGQKFPIPHVEVRPVEVASPFVDIPYPSFKIQFGELAFSFLVNANLENYIELFEWINDIGRPDEFDGRQSILTDSNPFLDESNEWYSDATATIYDVNYLPILRVKFQHLWPTYIGELEFSSTETDTKYITLDAKFQYMLFDLERVSS